METILNSLSAIIVSYILATSVGFNPMFLSTTAYLGYFYYYLDPSWWPSALHAKSDFDLILVNSGILAFVTYTLHGGIYLVLDILKRPTWLYRYKLQPKKAFDVDTLPKIGRSFAISVVVGLLPYAFVLYYTNVVRIDRDTLPTIHEFCKELVVIVLATEVCFYISHRVLHHKSIYQYIHKIHHEFTSPNALVAAYAHPFEFFVGNVLSVTAGVWINSTHLFTWYVWIVYGIMMTQVHHSGYRFPWHLRCDHEPDFHDLHHEIFNANYGLVGLMDFVCNTSAVKNKKVT